MEFPIPVAVPKAGPAPLPELAAYLAPFAPLFRRAQSRQSLERYVTGLLTDLPRKNCDTIAAAVAGTSTERLQHLLTDADWAPEALDEARVRPLVALSPPGGVLVLDDTGLPKKGTASVGVAPQYSGTLGKVANCQVVVSAEYVEDAPGDQHARCTGRSAPGCSCPRPGPRTRRGARRAHVPQEVAHQTKPELGLALVDRARAWGVPFAFVVADAGYGQAPAFLAGLEARGRALRLRGQARPSACACPTRSQAAAAGAPARRTRGGGAPPCPDRRPCGTPRPCWRVCRRTPGRRSPGARAPRGRWPSSSSPCGCTAPPATRTWGPTAAAWPTRGSPPARPAGCWASGPCPGHQGEPKQSFLWLPGWPLETPLARLVTLAHARWAVEQAYEDAKGECGLDDYQGRALGRPAPPPGPHLAGLHLPGPPAPGRHSPARRARGPRGAGLPPLGGRADGPRPAAPAEPARRPPAGPRLAAPGPRPLVRRHRPGRHLPPSA